MGSELKVFLTRKRSQMRPHSVGLNGAQRRRTHGLTREDMAELTGMSFKWYSLLESGTAAGVSRKLAERVAGVLRLNAAERQYFLSLLGFADNTAAIEPIVVPASLSHLVRSVDSFATALFSQTLDLLVHNSKYSAFFPASTTSSEFRDNVLWRLFKDPQHRAAWVDWAAVANRFVGDFRRMNAHLQHMPRYWALLDELAGSPEFQRCWKEADVIPMADSEMTFRLELPDGLSAPIEITLLEAAESPGLYVSTFLVAEPAQHSG